MIRVIKLGGSLLSLPGILPALDRWIRQQVPAANALVVGGGEWVHSLRMVQMHLGFNDSDAHWLAIEAMSLTGRMVSTSSFRVLSEGYPLVNVLSQVGGDQIVVLDIASQLRAHPAQLPESWSVTSDSLAAWAARMLDADELVLLKSRLPHGDDDDLVDAFFPQAAKGLPSIRIVDFRQHLMEIANARPLS